MTFISKTQRSPLKILTEDRRVDKFTKWPSSLKLIGFKLTAFPCHRVHQQQQKCTFSIFQIQKPKGPNLTFHKIGQSLHSVIMCAYFVVLESQVLHTKFQGNQPSGSGEEDFLMFLSYMGMVTILVMWPGPILQIFIPPSCKFGFNQPCGVSEKTLKECRRWMEALR